MCVCAKFGEGITNQEIVIVSVSVEQDHLLRVTQLLESLLDARKARNYDDFLALLTPQFSTVLTAEVFHTHCQALDLGECLEKKFLSYLHKNEQPLYVWYGRFASCQDDCLLLVRPLFLTHQKAMADAFWIF